MKNLFYIFLVLIVASCKKNTKYLTDNVMPPGDILNGNFQDTFQVVMKTLRYDSIKTYNDGFKYLGSNQDPVFGRTDASIYTNISIPNNVTNITFPADAIIDSAKIMLVFTQSFVGDTSTVLRYQIHTLTEDLHYDSTYYTTHKFKYDPITLADVYAKPFTYKGFQAIQIPIYKGFAQSIIANSQYLTDNTTFQNIYKGLYITTKNTSLNPSSQQGSLMKIDLANAISGFYIYYHTGNPIDLKESTTYQFVFNNSASTRVNHIDYNYLSGANIYLSQQLSGNITSCTQNVYLKGLNGTRVFVDFPTLKNIIQTNSVSINRAEVVVKVDNSFISNTTFYAPPSGISLLAIDSANNEMFTIDQYNSTYAYLQYGGTYDADNHQYVFNISRFIQQVLTGKRKYYGMYLVATDPTITLTARKDFFAARVVLGGYKNTALQPKLRIAFTSVP